MDFFSLKRTHIAFDHKSTYALKLSLLAAALMAATMPALLMSAEKTKAAVIETNDYIGNGDANCDGEIAHPTTMHLPLGKSTLMSLPEPLATRSVGDPGVLQTKLVSLKTLYLLGVNIGTTNMIIKGKSGKCTFVDVVVNMDAEGLLQTLSELLPEEKNIKVTAAADSLIVWGSVEDALTANRVIDIAQTFVRRRTMPVFASGDNTQMQMQMQMQQQQQSQQQLNNPQLQEFVSPRIVNMLTVSAQQQVMLEVKVAEVSKTLLDKLGASIALSKTSGSWTYTLLGNFLSTSGSATGGSIGGFKSANKNFTLDAEKRDGLIKVLAEPTIMAISGQEGSFLAGGRIFIPVAQNAGAGNTITLEEKEFGVGVKFTPTVLAGGRINLRVAPEVSELNREGVGVTATGFSGTAILPAFTTRKASTTVQLFDGQSFAIGGLIKNNTTANIKAFPILGEIPIIGALFRSSDFQNDKTELVFVVTPHLVKPVNPADIDLPTGRHTDPSRKEFFLGGKLEGKPDGDAPAKTNADEKQPAKKTDEPSADNATGYDLK